MSSGSSLGNISPKGSSDSGDLHENRGKRNFRRVSYPPPFWEEKMARSHGVIHSLLENNPDLRLALNRCPTLAGEFMKHPDVAREVARDKKLATEIIRRPHLLLELASFHKYAHMLKRREKTRKFIKHLEEKYIEENLSENGGLAIPLPRKNMNKMEPSESDSSVAIGRATLPNIPGRDESEHYSIKYLIKAQRLFLRHDVIIQHGCWTCCAKKIGYYNILNSHARLMYRVFCRHKQTGRNHFRPYELVVKDPDGITMFVFVQERDCKFRRKLAVEYPKGNTIGYVEERWSLRRRPFLLIRNSDYEAMIQVDCSSRPLLSHCNYHPKFIFQLRAIGAHNVIGKIAAEWIDTPPGAFTTERIYGVNFPQGLTVNVKILIMAAWLLVYLKYYSGKLEQYFHHTLTPEERAIIRMVEEDSEDEQHKKSEEPSSDSDSGKDEMMISKYTKHFEVAAMAAKKRIGVNLVLDDNKNT